jgi:hypothetical protein
MALLPDDMREHVVKALADLLVEALGEERDGQPTDGETNDSEDHA